MAEVKIDYAALKESIPLRMVLEQYCGDWLPGNVSGKWRASCPIHRGDNPSAFAVNEDDNVWHCFVCGRGGSVLDFVAAIEGISIGEAAERLQETYGGGVPHPQFRLLQDLRQTENSLRKWQNLHELPPPLGEEDVPLTTDLEPGWRDLSPWAISTFGLRRVPGVSWGTGVYIPLRNPEGVTVGYSIRQHDGLEPKYLNSRGLNKNALLYGFHENGDHVRETGDVVVVEGQLDCIRLSDNGIHGVVSTLGTGLSMAQAASLLRCCNRLIVVYDADVAGRVGAVKLKSIWQGAFDITIIDLPSGDPDENIDYIKEKLYDMGA